MRSKKLSKTSREPPHLPSEGDRRNLQNVNRAKPVKAPRSRNNPVFVSALVLDEMDEYFLTLKPELVSHIALCWACGEPIKLSGLSKVKEAYKKIPEVHLWNAVYNAALRW